MKRTDFTADLNLYAALFIDIAAWDCGLHNALLADFRRIERTVKTRGMPFIMIDMPDAGKILDSALSRGHLNSGDLPKTFGKIVCEGSREFLSKLFLKVFDSTGLLRPDVDPTSIFFLRQVLVLAKKVRKECSDEAVLEEVESFRRIENDCRRPSLDWDADSLDVVGSRRLSFLDGYRHAPDLVSNRDECPRPLLAVMDSVAGRIISNFPELDWRDLEPRHGPGAVADGGSRADKYRLPHWPAKLEGMFPSSYYAQSREDLHLETTISRSLNEPSARLIAVPKTLKAPRLIASEPTAHQFLQQGLMKWIRQNLPDLLKPCIDFTSQEPSRLACLRASEDGLSATVDLSAASDRLSCWTVERVMQYNHTLLHSLHAVRTRTLVNATGVGERYYLRLKKFAAQGSAVTFPVQTIVYAIASIAACIYEEGVSVNKNTIRDAAERIQVYGDDIVLPSHAVHALALLLSHLGLKVNASKTHYTGHFRESCGMDAFKGVDVTPVKARDLELGETAEHLSSWIDVSNNAYQKGLWSLSSYMVAKIPTRIRRLIPVTKEDLGCLTLYSYQSTPLLTKQRYNAKLCRDEVLGLRAEVRTDVARREDYQNLLQYFVEDPDPDVFWSAGYLVGNRIRLRKRWVPVTLTGVGVPDLWPLKP